MKIKMLILTLIFLNTLTVNASSSQEISGVITLDKNIEKNVTQQGALFIFAKKATSTQVKGVPPLAVLKVEQPQFPLAFTLTEKNAMMPGSKLDGDLTIYARYSPTGDALDKSGPEGSTDLQKKIHLGDKNIKIKLNKK